ncbi:hypothetical protein FKN01_00015 [Streptomyces sp. 130]|uniref:hypothetical protein n=1 Tax=Streptomyces sp. 130 TaxID=2591006 RepID=UPI00117E4DED|nr:hypothetical protein [Streptomyces sp. 130]TRV81741.1 hypothetical protein FKN01_00015 [Streptomyces sp. 130]
MTTEPTKAQRHARTLVAGQRILVRQLATRAAAWIRAGRRDDLDGVAAILGCILRMVILGGAAYGAWWAVRRWPVILWAVVPLWLWAAVRALGHDEDDGPTDAPAADTAAQREQLHALVRDLIGDRPGVHLSTLLDHLQKHGQGEGWTVSDLKARLPRLGVPVRRSVKVGKKVATGVHRDDLPAPSPAEGEQQAA